MQPRTLASRVGILEQKMEGLEGLPERIASLDERVASLTEQFSQFRVETRMEFSAVRGEMRGMREELIARIEAVEGAVGATRTEMREMRTELIARIEAVEGAAGETRTQMRVLHEEVIGRIALLDEHWNGANRARRPPRGLAGRRSKKAR